MHDNRKILMGRVVSDKMDKTVVVRVERRTKHRLYGKYITIAKTYKAHDEENRCHTGDVVRIVETRPLSAQKRWMVTDIVEQGVGAP